MNKKTLIMSKPLVKFNLKRKLRLNVDSPSINDLAFNGDFVDMKNYYFHDRIFLFEERDFLDRYKVKFESPYIVIKDTQYHE